MVVHAEPGWKFGRRVHGIDVYNDNCIICLSESEVNEFEPRLKSAKNRFQLNAGLNLEKLNTILSGTNHIWSAA